jgi:hypothetical protein
MRQKYTYMLPVNEPEGENGTVTVLVIELDDPSPVRRGAIVRRIIRKNYGLSRHEAKLALRAMEFDTLIT